MVVVYRTRHPLEWATWPPSLPKHKICQSPQHQPAGDLGTQCNRYLMAAAWRVLVWMKMKTRSAGDLRGPAGPPVGPVRPEAGSDNERFYKSH